MSQGACNSSGRRGRALWARSASGLAMGAMLAALAACGGSGSGGPSAQLPTPPPPVPREITARLLNVDDMLMPGAERTDSTGGKPPWSDINWFLYSGHSSATLGKLRGAHDPYMGCLLGGPETASPQVRAHASRSLCRLRGAEFVIYSVNGQNILHFNYSVNYSKM